MKKSFKDIILWGSLIVFVLFLFRQYVFSGRIPFPANLLASYYQPWAAYPPPDYPNGPPAKPIGFDNLRMFYPVRTTIMNQLKQGKLPLWNPYAFAGNTLLATYQSAVFHPLSWLFFLLPTIEAWSLVIIATPLMAAFLMYLFVGDLGLSRTAAVFGALAFAFSGIMIAWWEEMFMAIYSIIPLPIILLAIKRLMGSPSPGWAITLVLGVTASIFSGWFQATFYVLVTALLWSWFLWWSARAQREVSRLLLIILLFSAAILVSGIQLVPAWEAYTQAARGVIDVKEMFAEHLTPLKHLATLVAPDYFGNPAAHNYFGGAFYHERVIWIGIPALVVVLAVYLDWKRRTPTTAFFALLGIVAFSLGFNLPTSWLVLYSARLPFVSEMTPSRIFFVSAFAFSVLAAFGWEKVFSARRKKPLLMSLGLVGASLIVLWVLAANPSWRHPMYALVPIRNLVLPTTLFGLVAIAFAMFLFNQTWKRIAQIVIFAAALGGIMHFAGKYLYFSERRFLYPETPVISELRKRSGFNRVWSTGAGHIIRNILVYYGLFSPEGYESFNNKRLSELLYSSHTRGRWTPIVPRADALLYQAKTLDEVAKNRYTLRLLELLSVRFIALHHEDVVSKEAQAERFRQIWTDGVYDIVEYSRALPRALVITNYIVKSQPQRIIDAIYDPTFDPTTSVVLEEQPHLLPSSQEKPASASATITRYAPDRVEVTVESDAPALLLLTDAYFPGWQAWVNRKDASIYRANFAFRAVSVPTGASTVIFSYHPQSLTYGILFSVLGLVLTAGICVFLNKRRG